MIKLITFSGRDIQCNCWSVNRFGYWGLSVEILDRHINESFGIRTLYFQKPTEGGVLEPAYNDIRIQSLFNIVVTLLDHANDIPQASSEMIK
jgi:hypothetical protein